MIGRRMRQVYDRRWIVIIIEFALLIVIGSALYYQDHVAVVTVRDTSVATSSVVVPPRLDDKGGVLPTPPSSSANVWRGTTTPDGLVPYILVTGSCGPHYDGTCLNARSGPSTTTPIVGQLRNGMLLPVDRLIVQSGETWYRVAFSAYTHVLYPERVIGDWYVHGAYVTLLYAPGEKTVWRDGVTTTDKLIVVDRHTQMLYAYDGAVLFMQTPVSTGLDLTPTPPGTFTVFMMTPSSYMQGPSKTLPVKQYYDLPGVPWDLYFTKEGAVIHGAYWHDAFGHTYSHGCVNLAPADAQKLYDWAVLGTTVRVIN